MDGKKRARLSFLSFIRRLMGCRARGPMGLTHIERKPSLQSGRFLSFV